MPDQFRAEIAAIMAEDPLLERQAVTDPASRGWLRRPDFDQDGVEAWEKPDGRLVGCDAAVGSARPGSHGAPSRLFGGPPRASR